ncbi:TAXI family TRAP transporter solute-binding subunit [Streptomyces sp. KLOTTS4A1]|uniref:TAXI family TRAP transporter solute-binding subunit n=1 Tax=Streptomyces sp. KLOTTS4A1 TaxID=3390996 RepID=UPI0039F5385A
MSPTLARLGRRRALQGTAAALVVFGLLLWWLLPLGADRPGGQVVFSTGGRGGVYEEYGKLLDRAAVKDLPDLDIDLRTSKGSKENVERVADGRADITIAAADAVQQYKDSEAPGADVLRGCARLYDDYVHLVVAADSGIEKAADLRDKRVVVGPEGSGVRIIADRVLQAAGLDPAGDLQPLGVASQDADDLLERGEVDAFFWSGGLPTPFVEKLSERMEISLVPLGDVIEALHARPGSAGYYRASVMPADAYPRAQRGHTVDTIAVANLLVAADRVDDRLIEWLTRVVIDHRDSIGSEVHAAQVVDLRTALFTDPLELHEGARRYYRSVKP